MALIKVFSGSMVLALRLKEEIESEDIKVLVKDDIQSAIMAGIGTADVAVELYIDESDYYLVEDIIDDFLAEF